MSSYAYSIISVVLSCPVVQIIGIRMTQFWSPWPISRSSDAAPSLTTTWIRSKRLIRKKSELSTLSFPVAAFDRQACPSHNSIWLSLFVKSDIKIQIVGRWQCLAFERLKDAGELLFKLLPRSFPSPTAHLLSQAPLRSAYDEGKEIQSPFLYFIWWELMWWPNFLGEIFFNAISLRQCNLLEYK